MDEDEIEKWSDSLAALIHQLVADNLELSAKVLALQNGLISVASHTLKKPQSALWNELKRKQEYWHQILIEEVELKAPAAAAQIDQRSISSIWMPDEDDQTPPNFPSRL